MNPNMIFSLCSFIYASLIAIMYFSKERIKSVENKMYSIILMSTIIGLAVELLGAISNLVLSSTSIVTNILFKLIMLYFFSWIFELFIYVYVVSKNKKKINSHLILSVYLPLAILTLLLPLYSKEANGLAQYTYGPSVNFVYGISGILILTLIIIMIINIKHIISKKYAPLFAFMILGILMAIIQHIYPQLLLMSSVEAFVTILMYFTIENPDTQMIRELYKNRKLIEKSNEDTSNFLFKMTQDIKKPVKDIIEVSKNMESLNKLEELKQQAKYINNIGSDIDYLINDALDVSAMNTKQLKIYDSRYNPTNLFKEVEYRFENELDGNIKFHCEISKVVPNYLYGDSIKIKQAINSLLANSKKHTTSGEINMTVSGIVKYGICRLIIDINDTGKGMSIEQVNDVLSLNSKQLSEIDLHNRDGEILKLKEVKKLITILGGNLMVKSEENKGTTVNIVLDQKVVETKETEISKKLETYEQTLYKNKKVMVVDDDAKELAKITSYLENHEAEVSGSLFGRDCIEKIENNIKYDLILLDDETSTYSALEVLKELKTNKKFNIPVVVMINDSKEFIKLHYLQDGFADVILKSKLESEVNRIMKRF